MKNIVLVGISPLVKRRAEVFYIEELMAKGYKYTHCDLSPCFFEALNYGNILKEDYALTFSSLPSFERYIGQLDLNNTIFIVELFHEAKYKAIFNLMKKNKCLCVKFNPNASDFTYYKLSLFKQIKIYGVFKSVKNTLFSLWRLSKKLLFDDYYNIYSYLVSSGSNRRINIHINQQDWEKSRSLVYFQPLLNYRYAVFCDEYFPDHPDFGYLGGVDNIEEAKKNYRSDLNRFFCYIEEKYDVRVVIGAHPKSNYNGNEFEGRDIIQGKTMELVKHAQFSIIHGSMSISYSIIFNIPIILAVTDEMLKLDFYKRQSFIYSEYFGLIVNNLSRKYDACPVMVSDYVRNKYFYDFLTSPGIENMKNADILADAFSKM